MKKFEPESDSVLIARFVSGNTKAFETLMNPYRQRLYSYLCRMVGDAETARDLFQDVMVNVLKALPKYQEQQKFSSWLFSIAHNLATNYLQKQRRLSSMMTDDSDFDTSFELLNLQADDALSPEEILKNKELGMILRKAIEMLPVDQKQVLLLREYSELSFKEIAQMMDCPLNTVLGRMRYALLNLRKIVHQEIGGDISNVL
ncbi:sigma-70 family RNA polymerase sigma factor [candidate division KSB1 bacterium]|nr:sigma-70 family RNA polymerase sigma factor [candidate division KSB1 bacterium]